MFEEFCTSLPFPAPALLSLVSCSCTEGVISRHQPEVKLGGFTHGAIQLHRRRRGTRHVGMDELGQRASAETKEEARRRSGRIAIAVALKACECKRRQRLEVFGWHGAGIGATVRPDYPCHAVHDVELRASQTVKGVMRTHDLQQQAAFIYVAAVAAAFIAAGREPKGHRFGMQGAIT